MSGLVICTVRRGPCILVGTTGMMGTDMIEERMEEILIPAAKMNSDHWMLLRLLLNPVMLQDWSVITFAAVTSRRIDPLPTG